MDLREMHETFEVSLTNFKPQRVIERVCQTIHQLCIQLWFMSICICVCIVFVVSAYTGANAFGHCGYGSVASWFVNAFPAVALSEYLG